MASTDYSLPEDIEFWDDDMLALALPELTKIAESHNYPVKPTKDTLPCIEAFSRNTIKEDSYEKIDWEDVMIPRANMYIGEPVIAKAEKERRRIAIRPGRLKYLQTLERNLHKIIEYAIKAHSKGKLTKLHIRDKIDRDAANARARRYLDKHRKSVNARRRAKRVATADGVGETRHEKRSSLLKNETTKILENQIIVHAEKVVKF